MTAPRNIRSYDPLQVFDRWIANREIIYLDNNIWIELADNQAPSAARTAQALLQDFRDRRVLCPLSFAAISELIDQPNDIRRARRARLMDSLSDGVVLRNSSPICDAEASTLAPGGDLAGVRREAFSLLLDYLGDHFLLAADDSDLAFKLVEFIRDYMRLNAEARSVARLLELSCINEMRSRHVLEARDYLARATRDTDATRKDIIANRLSRAQVLKRVQQNVLDTCLFRRVLGRNATLPPPQEPRALSRLIARLPTMSLMAEIFTARYCDPSRKPQRQDFFDTEHATAAIYCDVFVTSDKNLFTILSRAKSIGTIMPCQILRGVEALAEHLEARPSATTVQSK